MNRAPDKDAVKAIMRGWLNAVKLEYNEAQLALLTTMLHNRLKGPAAPPSVLDQALVGTQFESLIVDDPFVPRNEGEPDLKEFTETLFGGPPSWGMYNAGPDEVKRVGLDEAEADDPPDNVVTFPIVKRPEPKG